MNGRGSLHEFKSAMNGMPKILFACLNLPEKDYMNFKTSPLHDLSFIATAYKESKSPLVRTYYEKEQGTYGTQKVLKAEAEDERETEKEMGRAYDEDCLEEKGLTEEVMDRARRKTLRRTRRRRRTRGARTG